MINLTIWLPTRKPYTYNKHFLLKTWGLKRMVELEGFYSNWRNLFTLDFRIQLRGHKGVWFNLGALGIEFGISCFGPDEYRELMGK